MKYRNNKRTGHSRLKLPFNPEIRRYWILLVALSWISISFTSQAQPILPDFHADPSARVFDGKLFIYPSHDAPGARNWKGMVDWHVFSTEDMVTWTDHGVAFGLEDISWADTEAWAPDCIERNGKYYFYFPAGGQIGVAVSDSPTGPFKDVLGHPLVKKGEAGIRYMIDPHIFIDDDGQAYLYIGGGRQLGVMKLKEDMITRDGPIQILDMPNFYEGVWVHKYNGIYYASYPTRPPGHEANAMVYSMAKSPLGPWEYKGKILDNHSHNVHGSITQFKGQWYLFYHVEGPSQWERRVCVEPLFYNEDGAIRPMNMAAHKGNMLNFRQSEPPKVYPVYAAGFSLSLNGEWFFKYISSLDAGKDSEFYKPSTAVLYWKTIKVPSNWELQGFADPEYGLRLKDGLGLYRRNFSVPAEWKDGRQVCIRFEGVAYGFELWVNGRKIGESWASAYNPHTFDITDAVQPGDGNVLAVQVSTKPRGYRFDLNDDWSLSGIFRDVTLFSVPPIHVQELVTSTKLAENGSAELTVAVTVSDRK